MCVDGEFRKMARQTRAGRASEVRRVPGVRQPGPVTNQGQTPAPAGPKGPQPPRAVPGGRPPTGARPRKRGEKTEEKALGTAKIDRSEQGAPSPMGVPGGPPSPSGQKPGKSSSVPLPPGRDDSQAKMKQDGKVPGAAPQDSEYMQVSGAIPGKPGAESIKSVFQINRNPSVDEMKRSAPPGRIQTPDYSIEKTPDGRLRDMTLTPEGKMKVEEGRQKMIQKLGKFPGHDDPNAPKPPVEPGEPFYNPYSNEWVMPDGDYESVLDKYGS